VKSANFSDLLIQNEALGLFLTILNCTDGSIVKDIMTSVEFSTNRVRVNTKDYSTEV
jgi:hypothetical protein